MHKNIVRAINYIINTCPYREFFEVTVGSRSTGGFWGMRITLKDSNAHTESLARIIKDIGMVYGEMVHIEREGNDIWAN